MLVFFVVIILTIIYKIIDLYFTRKNNVSKKLHFS